MPTCDPSARASMASVMRVHQVISLPMCGGEVGATLGYAPVRGLSVEATIDGSDARRMGILPGDVLLRLQNRVVHGLEDLQRGLANLARRAPMEVLVSRAGTTLELHGVHNEALLGVVIGESVAVPSGAVRIESLQPDSSATRSGLLAGDVVTHIGGARVLDVEQARNAIRLLDDGKHVEFGVERDGDFVSHDVVLSPRSDSDAF